MKPIILFRDDPNGLAPEVDERIWATNYFDVTDSRIIGPDRLVIPRYSALPFYKELERDIEHQGSKLINSYQEHRYVADLQNWYQDFADITPKTWFRLQDIPTRGSFILKGETNSKKFLWNTHMFASDRRVAIQMHSKLLEDSLIGTQSIYIREYIPLENYLISIQGLPISNEWRVFYYRGQRLSQGFYWSSHVEELEEKQIVPEPPDALAWGVIDKVGQRLKDKIPFVVADFAKTRDGRWILIELNDGTMSGLSENDPDTLYSNLQLNLINPGDYGLACHRRFFSRA